MEYSDLLAAVAECSLPLDPSSVLSCVLLALFRLHHCRRLEATSRCSGVEFAPSHARQGRASETFSRRFEVEIEWRLSLSLPIPLGQKEVG